MGYRHEQRVPLRILTTLWGMQEDGTLFVERARTLDISPRGARLAGVSRALAPGEIVGLQHGNCSGRFRVIWVGRPGTHKEGQVGVSCIEVGETVARALLFVEEQEFLRERYSRTLEAAGYQIFEAGLREALATDSRTFDVILLGHPVTAAEPETLISHFRRLYRNARVIIISSCPGALSDVAISSADMVLHRGVPGAQLCAKVEELIGPGISLKWPITRFSQRYAVVGKLEVRLVRSGVISRHQGRLLDLSENGARFVAETDLVPGEILTLTFTLPTASKALSLYAVVRHRKSDQYGAEFTEIAEEQRDSIRRLCQVLPPLCAPTR